MVIDSTMQNDAERNDAQQVSTELPDVAAMAPGEPAVIRIAVDVGGSFTDMVVIQEDGRFVTAKTPTTPADPAQGVFDALSAAARLFELPEAALLPRVQSLAVGTTIATNTMLELDGARSALLCTKGFRDDLSIRRGLIPRTRDFRLPPPPDLVPRRLRLPIDERIDKRGDVERPLREEELVAAARTLASNDVESVAVCFLNSFLNPAHERLARDTLKRELPHIHVSISSEVLPILGEYPRTSTTVVDAYLAPRTKRWLAAFQQRLSTAGFAGQLFVMQNNGGLIDVGPATRKPVLLTLSGPAAGAAGATAVSPRGQSNLLLFDMGGTSTDVTILRDGLPLVTDELDVNGYEVMLPAVDVHTVAAGGGAIASVDSGGLLHVGPLSAGAVPGPAALGSGTEPTVTDANVVLGRLDAQAYAGGRIPLYPDRARDAFDQLGERLGTSAEDAALGVVELAEEKMARAIHAFSLWNGIDPRQYALVSAGGAAGLHAVAVARKIGISRVYVPKLAPVFCAMGALYAALRRDIVRSCLHRLDEVSAEELNAELERLRQAAAEESIASGDWSTDRIRYEHAFAMRYRGQIFQLEISVSPTLSEADIPALNAEFHRRHAERYEHDNEDGIIEISQARLTVLGEMSAPALVHRTGETAALKPVRSRTVLLGRDSRASTPVYLDSQLGADAMIDGPALIDSDTTTVLIPEASNATCLADGSLMIELT